MHIRCIVYKQILLLIIIADELTHSKYEYERLVSNKYGITKVISGRNVFERHDAMCEPIGLDNNIRIEHYCFNKSITEIKII